MTDTEPTKLLPCPFCQRSLINLHFDDQFQHPENNCVLSRFILVSALRESWNRRTPPAPQPAPETERPSVLFRPRIYKDGNSWCALYGDNLQSGIAGFGDTPEKACAAFDEAWRKP